MSTLPVPRTSAHEAQRKLGTRHRSMKMPVHAARPIVSTRLFNLCMIRLT